MITVSPCTPHMDNEIHSDSQEGHQDSILSEPLPKSKHTDRGKGLHTTQINQLAHNVPLAPGL